MKMRILTLLLGIFSFLEILYGIGIILSMIYGILGFFYGQENGHAHADDDDYPYNPSKKKDDYPYRYQNQTSSTSSSNTHICSFCGDGWTNIRCSRCKVARYCSEKCQINHWREDHKYECKKYNEYSPSVFVDYRGDRYHHCLSCGDDKPDICCTRCKVARYCSGYCQTEHWKARHHLECKEYKSPSNSDLPTAPASGDLCFVCGDWSNICCSRCNAIRYCSQACETEHWREGHNLECEENKSPANVYSASAVNGRRGPGHVGTSSSMYQKSKKDGKLTDTVQSPKRTSSKELPSVEECPICFRTIHTSEPSCPLLACDNCNNKFHSTCLLKWFSTSKKSRCPLCQYPFSNRKVQP